MCSAQIRVGELCIFSAVEQGADRNRSNFQVNNNN